MPFGYDQKVPIGDWITILYRNDRVLFGDDAVFDGIVTKRAKGHKSEFQVASSSFCHRHTRTGYFYKNNEWILIKFLLDRIYRIIRIFFCFLSFEMKLSKSIRFAETIMLVKIRNDHS